MSNLPANFEDLLQELGGVLRHRRPVPPRLGQVVDHLGGREVPESKIANGIHSQSGNPVCKMNVPRFDEDEHLCRGVDLVEDLDAIRSKIIGLRLCNKC